MKKIKMMRLKVKFLVAMGSMLASLACNKDMSYQQPSGQGSHEHTQVHLFLTDDPALVFDHVYLNIIKVEIKAEDSDQLENEREHEGESDDNDRHGDSSGGWVELNMQPAVYDILHFRNGLDTLLASGNFLTANMIRKVRLVLGNDNSVVFQGNTFPLVIKDDRNIVLIKLDDDFAPANISGALDFSLDFDAGRSIRFHNNQYEWQSDIRAFRKEKSGSIEGHALPSTAKVVVTATNGVDTSTALIDAEGEYKITGLKPGTYSVNFHANAGNFADATVQNVIVREQEDTHLATVTLHP